MWAARLLPASQQRRFVGAGGRRVPAGDGGRSGAGITKRRLSQRQAEVTSAAEDYAGGPVNLPKSGTDPWSQLAQRPCRLCSIQEASGGPVLTVWYSGLWGLCIPADGGPIPLAMPRLCMLIR